MIEKKNKMTIAEIFKLKGEAYFRKEEELITLKYLDEKESVISLGGGAFINDKIRKKVLSDCFSVWLNLNLENLCKRLKKNKKRPLIKNNNLDDISKVLFERKKIYSKADRKINCDNLSFNQIINKIIKLYE